MSSLLKYLTAHGNLFDKSINPLYENIISFIFSFIQEFLASEGKLLNPRGDCPVDPYTESRNLPLRSYKTPPEFDKLKQFLELDRKVLRFHCIWDDRDSMFGEIRPCVRNYFVHLKW